MAHDSLNPDNDPFAPPVISTVVHCIHCGEEYDSYRIEWRIERDAGGEAHGFWCCPIEGCDGKGFGFDIFPVDPEYRDENGELMWCSDESGEDHDEFDDEQEWEDSELIDDNFEDLDGSETWDQDEAPAKGAHAEPEDDIPY
ncbi:MAG: hypothetical protein AB7G28_14590 [Pirellulales bacterium]